jgi:hypothetical protein
MGFFHWLWYDFWEYGAIEAWIGAVFIGYYLIRWALNGFRIPRYKEKNMNTHREFHDYM